MPVIAKAVVFVLSALAVVLVIRWKAEQTTEMKGYIRKTPLKKFTRVPGGNKQTFFADKGTVAFPMIRALRDHGWRRVDDINDAQIVYQYRAHGLLTKLSAWQRMNHVPGYKFWNYKDTILDGFLEYRDRSGSELYFLPESYRLTVPEDVEAFDRRIKEEEGSNFPWVLKHPRIDQGKGIEMIAPNSPRLFEVSSKMEEEAPDYGYIIQRYICNEMTWNKRKFDVRMFWMVASVDPPIVLYHDGFARIGNSDYHEDNFEDTVSHLTSHTGLGEELKAPIEQFRALVREHHRSTPKLWHIRDPVQHVKNQIKDSLGEFIEAFVDKSFSHPGEKALSSENTFGFYGADFIFDADLDVWFIEPQKGIGMDEDYKFRVKLHDEVFSDCLDILEEVWQKQEAGEAVLPLKHTGGWEVIYGDGWRYKYDGYERAKNKAGCELAPK